MGDCKMYLYVERRVNGQWHIVNSTRDFKKPFFIGRNEIVFAQLAGVRNHRGLTPLDVPRGLPMGPTSKQPSLAGMFSFWVHMARYQPGSHRDDRITSWFTLDELLQYDWSTFSCQWNETEFSVDVMDRLRQLSTGNLADVRIIFWFDDTSVEQKRYDARVLHRS